VKLVVIGVVATAPIISREPVPELPKSRALPAWRQLPTPTPLTRQRPSSSRLTPAPSARTAPAVLVTSPDSKSPDIRVSPRAMAPRIRARWEMDLSPGTRAVPAKAPALRANSGWTLSGGGAVGIGGLRLRFTGGARSGKRALHTLFFMGTRTLVKADLGTKRACPSCGARFYDLSKRPIECPKCGFSFEPEALYKQRRGRQPEVAEGPPPAAENEDEEAEEENEDLESENEEEAETVEEAPLIVAATGEDEDEAAEEEEAEADSGMSVVEGDEDVAIEDIEVEGEDEDEDEDDDLLAEVEEDEEDVSGIIDPGITKDEG
jgi:uncharacterized protein (TIGR02300 family)